MAITTMDRLVAGFQAPQEAGKDASTAEQIGVAHSLWYVAGMTAAGAAPTGGLNGAVFTGPSVTGQLPFPAAVAGSKSYLAHLEALQAAGVGSMQVVDRLWGNVPVVTTAGAQAVTSPTWPARDINGATTGVGVRLALEVSSTTGNLAAVTNTTVSYTNSSGTASRTATLASAPITSVTGTWLPLTLASGDVGVRSVQSITLGTSYVSGAIHLVAYRHIARMGFPSTAYASVDRDWTQLGLPWVPDTAVPGLIVIPTATAVGAVQLAVTWAQG